MRVEIHRLRARRRTSSAPSLFRLDQRANCSSQSADAVDLLVRDFERADGQLPPAIACGEVPRDLGQDQAVLRLTRVDEDPTRLVLSGPAIEMGAGLIGARPPRTGVDPPEIAFQRERSTNRERLDRGAASRGCAARGPVASAGPRSGVLPQALSWARPLSISIKLNPCAMLRRAIRMSCGLRETRDRSARRNDTTTQFVRTTSYNNDYVNFS
jgi:hypothetical protein